MDMGRNRFTAVKADPRLNFIHYSNFQLLITVCYTPSVTDGRHCFCFSTGVHLRKAKSPNRHLCLELTFLPEWKYLESSFNVYDKIYRFIIIIIPESKKENRQGD
ncbi:hypothetical protein AVEN_225615-1 [Araneus ventricosus]|uniref:Uncharacterized protein n=1 Tax=Araneus ventricosus TaxID=182803 RepID=A0A4Y2EXY4_ARAVE|nr:hypothetical protein AVEN_225615-1 [Araneus ventricosus]